MHIIVLYVSVAYHFAATNAFYQKETYARRPNRSQKPGIRRKAKYLVSFATRT